MALEGATYIAQLNPALPPKSDPLGEADAQFRQLKQTITSTFAGSDDDRYDTPVTIGPRRLNQLGEALNVSDQCTLSTAQTVTGQKTFSAPIVANQVVRAYDKSNVIAASSGAAKAIAIGATSDVNISCTEPKGNGVGGVTMTWPSGAGSITANVITDYRFAQIVLDFIYPVGAVIVLANATNPNTVYNGSGFASTWVATAQGRMIVGAGTTTDSRGETYTSVLGNKSGALKHVLTASNIPTSLSALMSIAGDAQIINPAAAGTPVDHVNPHEVFNIWKRTA